jgi:protein TonB
LRWPRLAVCLLASVALHIAVLAKGPGQPANTLSEPVFVRLVPLPEPASRAPRFTQKHEPSAEDRPMAAAKSPWAPRVPVAPAAPQPPPPKRRAGPERAPSIGVYPAYGEFGEERQAEKLGATQRRVPRANALLRAPEPLDPIRPSYPRAALERGLKGDVLLEVFITAGGAVEDVIVVEDYGKPELAEAAAQAVRRSVFHPAEGTGGATRSRMTLRFIFTYE